MARGSEKAGFFDREGRRWAKIHAAIAAGLLAVEAFFFPHQAALDATLETGAEIEGVHAVALEGIHRVAQKRRAR